MKAAAIDREKEKEGKYENYDSMRKEYCRQRNMYVYIQDTINNLIKISLKFLFKSTNLQQLWSGTGIRHPSRDSAEHPQSASDECTAEINEIVKTKRRKFEGNPMIFLSASPRSLL